ncbi:MAG: sugar-binding protein [Spirochaetota bacterium]
MNPRLIITIILAAALLHADDAKEALIRHYQELESKHKESRSSESEFNILKNGDFSQEKKAWQFHLCALEKADGVSVTAFRSKSKDYRKVWQIIPVTLRPGSTVRLRANIKIVSSEGTPPKLFVDFLNAAKKNVYDDKERGMKLDLKGSADFQDYEITYRVPEGAVTVAPSFAIADVAEVYLRSMSLTATLTFEEASALGIAAEKARSITPTGDAAQRMRLSAAPNAVIPVIHPKTIIVDGDPSDWRDVDADGSIDRHSGPFSTPDNEQDASGKFKLAMDDENLYILVSIADETLVFGKEKNWNDDSVEVFISPDFNQDVKNGERETQLVFCPQNDAISDVIITGRKFAEVGALVKGARTSKGFRLEIAIPLENSLFALAPFDGRPFGFNISYSDNDRGKGRDHKVTWSMYDAKDESFKKPSVLGAAVVVSGKGMPLVLDTRPASTDAAEEEREIVNTNPGHLNLLVNGDFERDDEGWHNWYGIEGLGLIYASDTGTYAQGTRSFCIDGTARAGLAASGRSASAGRFMLCAHTVNVLPGEKYRIAFSVKTTSAGGVSFTVRTKTPSYIIKSVGKVRITAADGWLRKEFDFTIPADHVKKDNVMQTYFDSFEIAGEKMWFDNVVLTRFVPGDIDAQLIIGKHDQSFAPLEKKIFILSLTNSGAAADLKVQYSARDFHYKTNVSAHTMAVTVSAGEWTNIPLVMSVTALGNFKISVAVEDIKTRRKIFRETDISICARPKEGAEICQIMTSHAIYLPKSAAAIAETMASLKVRTAKMFVHSTYEVSPGKYDFSSVDTILNASAARGVDTILLPRVVKEGSNKPISDLEAFYRDLFALASHLKGKVFGYEIGNEVDLWMGWPPNSDPREYSMLLRTAYNAVKSADPSALVMTAGFNCVSYVGFMNDFVDLNKGNFYDVFAFHFYDFLTSANYKEDMAALMNGLSVYHRSPVVYDTESGSEPRNSMEESVELIAKKRPFLLYHGVARHHEFGIDRMVNGHMYAYYGSSAPTYPTFSFQTGLYAGAVTAGRAALNDYVAYLFAKGGRHFAAVWKEGYAPKTSASVPVKQGYAVYDVFGNDITARFPASGGVITVALSDRIPVYVNDIDVEALPSKERFTPAAAFKPVTYDKNVLLLTKDFTGFFDVTLVKNESRPIPVYVKNFGRSPASVVLSCEAAVKQCAVDVPVKTITLAPGEKKDVLISLCAAEAISNTSVTIAGTVNGISLAPLVLSVSVQGDISIEPESRFVRVRNNGSSAAKGAFHISSKIQDVAPLSAPITISPGDEQILPYDVISKSAGVKESHGAADISFRFVPDSRENEVLMRYQPAFALAQQIEAGDIRNAASADALFAKGPAMNLTGDGGTANVLFGYRSGELTVIARVADGEHEQVSVRGQIGQGDSIIIGIDPNDDSRTKGFQDDDFECGFALRSDGQIIKYSHDWKHNTGLEGARPFDAAHAAVFREGMFTYYALRIPTAAPRDAKQMGVSLLINNYGKSGKKGSMQFGGGLDENRNASKFGRVVIIK